MNIKKHKNTVLVLFVFALLAFVDLSVMDTITKQEQEIEKLQETIEEMQNGIRGVEFIVQTVDNVCKYRSIGLELVYENGYVIDTVPNQDWTYTYFDQDCFVWSPEG